MEFSTSDYWDLIISKSVFIQAQSQFSSVRVDLWGVFILILITFHRVTTVITNASRGTQQTKLLFPSAFRNLTSPLGGRAKPGQLTATAWKYRAALGSRQTASNKRGNSDFYQPPNSITQQTNQVRVSLQCNAGKDLKKMTFVELRECLKFCTLDTIKRKLYEVLLAQKQLSIFKKMVQKLFLSCTFWNWQTS